MNHPTDEKLYLLVAHELSVNKHEEALWTMAFALENGDEAATKAHYIRLRVAQLKSEFGKVEVPAAAINEPKEPQPSHSPPLQPYIRVDMARATDADQPDLLNEYKAVVGERNLDYYLTRFAEFDDQGGGLISSWNWSAFLWNLHWAIYRKLYGWGVGLLFVLAFIYGLLGKHSPSAALALSLVVLIPFGLFANSLYWKKCQKKIEQARSTNRDEKRALAFMQQHGGVHGWIPKVAITLAVVTPVLGIVLSILLPKMQAKKDVPPPVSSTPKTPYDPDKYAFLDHPGIAEHTMKHMAEHGLAADATVADVDNWGHNEISRWRLNDKDRASAVLAATRWSKQSLIAAMPPAAAYFYGFLIVKGSYEAQHQICSPSPAYGPDAAYSYDGAKDELRVHQSCYKIPY